MPHKKVRRILKKTARKLGMVPSPGEFPQFPGGDTHMSKKGAHFPNFPSEKKSKKKGRK